MLEGKAVSLTVANDVWWMVDFADIKGWQLSNGALANSVGGIRIETDIGDQVGIGVNTQALREAGIRPTKIPGVDGLRARHLIKDC
jgi:hypothetical protein